MKRDISNVLHMDTVCVNVGGVLFTTTLHTLRGYDSFFQGLSHSASVGHILFVDRDPTHFRHVLNWLRGARTLPDDGSGLRELLIEADFYSMVELCSAIRSHPHFHMSSDWDKTLVRIADALCRS